MTDRPPCLPSWLLDQRTVMVMHASNQPTHRYDHLREYHEASMRQRGNEAEFDNLARPAELKISQHILVNFVCVVVGSVLHGVLSALL